MPASLYLKPFSGTYIQAVAFLLRWLESMIEFYSSFMVFVPDKIPDKVTALLIGLDLIYCNGTAQVELSELFELR